MQDAEPEGGARDDMETGVSQAEVPATLPALAFIILMMV